MPLLSHPGDQHYNWWAAMVNERIMDLKVRHRWDSLLHSRIFLVWLARYPGVTAASYGEKPNLDLNLIRRDGAADIHLAPLGYSIVYKAIRDGLYQIGL